MDPKAKKEFEEKLLISEIKYRRLFEAAQDGILIIDPVTEDIIDANPYLLQMIGYSLDEVRGKKLWEIGAAKDTEAIKKLFKDLYTEKSVRYEDLPLKTKDGREIAVEFVSNLYPINSVSMIQCNIRDITERKSVEDQARVYLEGLERLNKFMTGRELKMIELKAEIDKLKARLFSKEPDSK